MGRGRLLSDEKTLTASAQTLGGQRSEEKCSEEDQVAWSRVDNLQIESPKPSNGCLDSSCIKTVGVKSPGLKKVFSIFDQVACQG